MKELKPAILTLVVFTLLCGGLYPAVVTAIAWAVFPVRAAGSFTADRNGRTVGSLLIGQPFSSPRYFWPRPSATTPFPYNPLASGGSNLGPTNPVLLKQVAERIQAFRNQGVERDLPVDLVYASASGLDPHISPEAALVQVDRVAKARGMSTEELTRLVDSQTEDRTLGLLGAPRVNVLGLNLALDRERP